MNLFSVDLLSNWIDILLWFFIRRFIFSLFPPLHTLFPFYLLSYLYWVPAKTSGSLELATKPLTAFWSSIPEADQLGSCLVMPKRNLSSLKIPRKADCPQKCRQVENYVLVLAELQSLSCRWRTYTASFSPVYKPCSLDVWDACLDANVRCTDIDGGRNLWYIVRYICINLKKKPIILLSLSLKYRKCASAYTSVHKWHHT